MKKISLLLISAALLAFAFAGCGQTAPATDDDMTDAPGGKISIVSVIFPTYDFARAIAGDKADITMLLPPGSETHSFEPTAQDIIQIQNCDVFIHVGGESDSWVSEILNSMDTSKMKIIALMDCVNIVEEEIVEGMEEDHEHGHEETHSDAPEYDEHVWTSPQNAKLIVQKISDALCEADAKNAPEFRQNEAVYLDELNALHEAFQAVVDDALRTAIVFGDRFPFRYLADAYGLDYFAAFPGCSTETEASAKTVAFLIDKVKDENIPVVFHIELSNEKMADTICEFSGAKKLLLHSCHNISKNEFLEGVTYLDLMNRNVEALKEALQ